MEDLDDFVLFKIASYVHPGDRWLLRYVCKRFDALFARDFPQTINVANKRAVDFVASQAVEQDSWATVRFLMSLEPTVYIQNDAMLRAASTGNFDFVKEFALRLPHTMISNVITAALKHGHVIVAEFLWPLGHCKSEIFDYFLAATSNAISFAWMLKKFPDFISQHEYQFALFEMCCDNTLETLKLFLAHTNFPMERDDLHRIRGRPCLSLDYDILTFLSRTFGYRPMYGHVLRKKNNAGAIKFCIEQDRDHLVRLAALETYPMYFYKVFREYNLPTRPLDLRDALTSPITSCDMTHLFPDPGQWVSTFSPDEMGRIMETSCYYTDGGVSFAEFFQNVDIRVSFTIQYTRTKEHFEILSKLGGRCTVTTLTDSLSTDDVCHVRQIYDALKKEHVDLAPMSTFHIVLVSCQLVVLKFAYEELGLHNLTVILESFKFHLTRESARFIIEKNISDKDTVLQAARMYGHADVIAFLSLFQPQT